MRRYLLVFITLFLSAHGCFFKIHRLFYLDRHILEEAYERSRMLHQPFREILRIAILCERWGIEIPVKVSMHYDKPFYLFCGGDELLGFFKEEDEARDKWFRKMKQELEEEIEELVAVKYEMEEWLRKPGFHRKEIKREYLMTCMVLVYAVEESRHVLREWDSVRLLEMMEQERRIHNALLFAASMQP